MNDQRSSDAITLAAVNEKGGVTKTTTTANLAVMLSRLGLRVLAVDGDPQGHLTFTFGYERNTLERTLYDVMLGTTGLQEVILPTYIHPEKLSFFDPGVAQPPAELVRGPDLVPVNMRASAADGELRGKLTWPTLLRKALAPVMSSYDYVLIDTNPSLGVLTVNALCASQSILIPLVPEVLSVQGLGDLLQVVRQVQDDAINPDLTIAGIVFAKVQKYKGHREIITTLRGDLSQEYEVSCFKTELRQSATFTNAANRRSVVVISDAYSDHAKDYWRLLAELLEAVGGPGRGPVQRVVRAIQADTQ